MLCFLPSKKSIIVPYLLFVSIACFGDTYTLDDANLQIGTKTDDLPQALTKNTTPEQPDDKPDTTNTLQLLDKLEALNLIATNPAYDHLNSSSEQANLADDNSQSDEELDFSLIQTSPHELALTQVLSEICPPLLDETLHNAFTHSYHAHLKLLMPSLDPNVVMPKINEHPEYIKILQGVREWTMGYPDTENKELCAEFAEATF